MNKFSLLFLTIAVQFIIAQTQAQTQIKQPAISIGSSCVIVDNYFLITTPEVRKVLQSKGYTVLDSYPDTGAYFTIQNDYNRVRSPLAVFKCGLNGTNYLYSTKIKINFADDVWSDIDRSTHYHAECEKSAESDLETLRANALLKAAQRVQSCEKSIKRANLLFSN